MMLLGLSWSSNGKESACNAGDAGGLSFIPGPRRAPREKDGSISWDNPLDGGAWWAIVHGVAKSQIQLSDRAHVPAVCVC